MLLILLVLCAVLCVCVWVCFLHVNTAIITPANLELGKTRESPGCMDELSDYIYIVVRNCQDCLENMLSCQLTKASILFFVTGILIVMPGNRRR